MQLIRIFKKFNRSNFIFLLIVIFFIIHFKLFENVYLILKYNFNERKIANYGYCEKTSYGFVKFIDEKFKIKKNIHVYNDDKRYPYSEAFIHKPKIEYSKRYFIILNYNELNSKIDINNFKVIEKFKNCMFLELND